MTTMTNTREKSLMDQLQPGTMLGVACLLNNTVDHPAWRNLMRDIPAHPKFADTFTVGEVAVYILEWQLAKQRSYM